MTAPVPPKRESRIQLGFALVAAALIAGFAGGMFWWITSIIASPDWCDRAIGAAKDAPGNPRPETSVGGCFNLLNEQVRALALNSHIFAGGLIVCLVVVILLVVAGGHMRFRASTRGVEGDIGRGEAAGAEQAADAAKDVAEDLREQAGGQPGDTPPFIRPGGTVA